jgi:2-hydroxy-3-oxopropionate reductase
MALTVHDQRKEAAKAVLEAGGIWAETGRDVAQASDIVITMQPNSPEVEQAVLGRAGVLDGAHV